MAGAELTTIAEPLLALALADAQDRCVAVSDLRRLPKADVHCHALLNCPLSTYEGLLGHKLPLPPARFGNFGEFGGYLATNLFPAICSLANVRAILRGGLERMADEGVVYAEASIDLLMPSRIGVAPHAVLDLVAEERERIASRLCFAPEIGINRRISPDTLWPRSRRISTQGSSAPSTSTTTNVRAL